MATNRELARSIYVRRDEAVALLREYGEAEAVRLVGALVKCSPGTDLPLTIGMVVALVETAASAAPQTPSQRIDDAVSAPSTYVTLVNGEDPNALTLVKAMMVVCFGGKQERATVGLGELSNEPMKDAEHAAFSGRAARANAGIDTSTEHAVTVRRRLQRANAAVAVAVQSVPLADLLAKLEASESGRMNASLAATTPVVKRLMSERDRYRAQVAVKEAEVNSLLATMPRRIEQATHDANKRVAELEKLQAVLHTEVAKGNQERVEFEAAFTALEQELTKKAQETARLLQALASAFGEDVPSVARAEAILCQRRPSE
jgi:hypothetical protein